MVKKDKTVKRRLAGAYVSSVLSISLVLLLVGTAALVGINARTISDWFKENMQMEVFLRSDVSDAQGAAFQTQTAALPYVKTSRLITREQGAAELRAMLGEDFLDVFQSTSVPLSIELTLKADYVNADSLALVSSRLKQSPLVDEVESRTPLVDTINKNLSKLTIIVGVLVLLLLFISLVLIGNTVRLGIYARRFTVNTMQLVGASPSFIRRPFMRDAFVLGLVSSLLTLAIIGAALYFALQEFTQLASLFTYMGLACTAAIIVGVGVLICLISTFFVVNHLLYMDKDKLYY